VNIRQTVAESLLGEIDWRESGIGFCRCPGADLHTHTTDKRACRVHVDGPPNIFCVHSSCAAVVAEMNERLPREIGKAEREHGLAPARFRPTAEDRHKQVQERAASILRERAKRSLATILRRFAGNRLDLFNASPTSLVGVEDGDLWRHLLRLFDPADVLWIGDVRDSGTPAHAAYFQTVRDWLSRPTCPGPRIVPSAFKPGTFSRTKENVAHRRFLIVENDRLPLGDQVAVIRYVEQFSRLRAIVFSGNKSFHAWFDIPSRDHERQLAEILPQFGVDPAGFRPAQPFRMPGVKREDRESWTDLVYLDAEGGR